MTPAPETLEGLLAILGRHNGELMAGCSLCDGRAYAQRLKKAFEELLNSIKHGDLGWNDTQVELTRLIGQSGERDA